MSQAAKYEAQWPNDSTSQVRATIFSTDLNTLDVPYNALSYAWTHDTSATVMINGHPFNISSDLHQCLQAMSKHVAKGALSFLWVDAICINQADDVERAAQVAIMSQIYRGCRECLVWLGPEQDDSHLVFALVEEFEEMCLVDPQQIQKMNIKIDYSISTNRLWGAITSRVVKNSKSLNILSLCQPVAADPDYKEVRFRATTILIQHFLDNSMNDFDTALAVLRRNSGETGSVSMAIDGLSLEALERAKKTTQELQSQRHLMSDSEFKRQLVQAWLPPSKCDRYRLPTWVPNWSNTRKISSQILYGVENGRIAKRDFRASKDTESDACTLADLDPASLPDNTAVSDWGSFTTLSFKCHKVDTIAQTFEAHGNDQYQAVLEFWLVQSNLHPMLASMRLPERVTAFVDTLLLRARNDTTHLYGYDDMVDRWIRSSREACMALINESADVDKPIDVPDSSAKPSAPTLHFVDTLELLASDTVELPTPKYMDAPDWTPENYRAKLESLRESWSRMNELEGNYNIFITRGGFIGLAGYYVERGDVVCIPLGCDVPLIIRPAPDTSTTVQRVLKTRAACGEIKFQEFQDGGSKISNGISELLGPEYRVVERSSASSENYWLISESYVAGIMNGEYLDQLDDGVEPEMVTIY
ncbi:heterokaryon incompatibility protein-domain-containing protein [Plectosphaerella plurivora]|uniref:Heterokaryon incompatibility protein-domain-containing protein n=1 Tax=Plectosphaerella plurivora TaxID=936078 RepID=A0A9P8V813_9PEZI|nr:heterokaryon incompatibility protein-domain-containing protein [Plectosphaerella plurivora]